MKNINRGLLTAAVACLPVPAFAHYSIGDDDTPQMGAISIQESSTDENASGSTGATEPGENEQQAATAESARTQDDSGRDNRRRLRSSLEEVVVTAQRREERLQDVPISIAVVTADDIDRRGLVSGADYLRGVPGVNQTSSGYGENITIRGIETQTEFQNAFSGSTVATYFGETPTTNSGGILGTSTDLKLVDIERVEVLRGPQGTAFGSAALGGAVRTIPVAPKLDRFDGKLVAAYSVTADTGGDNYNVQAVGNFPLITDKLALRAVIYQYEDSGFYRNVAASSTAFRSGVVTPYRMESFAIDEREVGDYHAIGGRVAALLQATDAMRLTLTYAAQRTEVDGWLGALSEGPYQQTQLRLAPEHVRRGESAGYNDGDTDLVNMMLEYDFGWADLLTTYSYLKSVNTAAYAWPSRVGPFPVSQKSGPFEHYRRVGEIRLATRLDGAWDFVGGLYAENLEDGGSSHLVWYGEPTQNLWGTERVVGEAPGVEEREQKAAFGEVSWKFAPGFTLTGGVRAYEYDHLTRGERTGALLGEATILSETNASGTSFRGNLSYKINDTGLVYASWSQGFRLGRPQAGLNAQCDMDNDGVVDGTSVAMADTRTIESDSVDNYEIGGNVTLLDRRLTVSGDIYRMDWTDLPIEVFVPGGCGGLFDVRYTDNIGAARSDGIELQVNWQITDALRVDVGGSWIQAELTKDAPAINAFTGNRLPGSPEYNANLGLQYEFSLANHNGFLRVDSVYVGDYYGAVQTPPAGSIPAGDYVKVDASVRVGLGDFDITVFVRNLTNEDAFTFRGGSNPAAANPFRGYLLRPRTVGIQLGYNF